jgi:hypothetical protein
VILFFSIVWIIRPIQFEEIRIRHPTVPDETLTNKSSLETNTTLKDFFFSKPNDLKFLEKSDEIILPRIIDSSMDSTEEARLISSKKDYNLDGKSKTGSGKNSIFVEAYQGIRLFPARPKVNYYDPVAGRFVNPLLKLAAQKQCMKEFGNLPRKITQDDKEIKFSENFVNLFKKNENFRTVFSYNIYLEKNIAKDASRKEIKQATQNLFKKYGKEAKKYLRENLFENPCIIKCENCKYYNFNYIVTIYYDEFTDLFAIVSSKTNNLLDFGIATETKYTEIFRFKSFGKLKEKELWLLPNEKVEDYLPFSSMTESKELEVYEEKYILTYEAAMDILIEKYGPNFVAVQNGEFEIDEWQAAKKIEHADTFGIKFEDYGFSKKQAVDINQGKGGIVDYIRRGNKLPCKALISAYQENIKRFCESKSVKMDTDAIFRGEPAIIFWKENKETEEITFVIFNSDTKRYRTCYKMESDSFQAEYYKKNKVLGERND